MRMVATNGHRLAKMDVPASGGSTADLIVPPKALEQIRRLYPGDAEIEIAKSDNHIGFRAGGTLVFSRLIEGPYPNYEQVIPRENDKHATVDKMAMAAALRRMSVVASDQTHRIRLAFSGGNVKFSVQTPDLGEAQDELTVTYEVKPHPMTRTITWDAFRNHAPNPLSPTLQEAMDETLTPREQEQFVAHVRPLVERGEGSYRMASAYVRALKT